MALAVSKLRAIKEAHGNAAIGYYIGKVQLESLFAEVALERGRDFSLKNFHDEFLEAGVIPISLIRWEMTGDGEQVASMRNAPPLE